MHDGVGFAIFISFVLGVIFPYRYEHVPPSDSKRDSPTAGNTMSKATGLRSSEFSISRCLGRHECGFRGLEGDVIIACGSGLDKVLVWTLNFGQRRFLCDGKEGHLLCTPLEYISWNLTRMGRCVVLYPPWKEAVSAQVMHLDTLMPPNITPSRNRYCERTQVAEALRKQ